MNDRYLYKTKRVAGRVVRQYIGRLSDPVAQLVFRTHRLNAAANRSAVAQRKGEVSQTKVEELEFKLLAATTKYWSLLDLFYDQATQEAKRDIEVILSGEGFRFLTFGQMRSLMPNKLAFLKLCESADRGDTAAQQQVEEIRQRTPRFVAAIVDLVAIARRQVVQSLAGDSHAATAALEASIDERVKSLTAGTDNDPLGRMYAEIAAIAWMDSKRCLVASTREPISHRETKFWTGQADRAVRRFDRIARLLQARREQQPEQQEPE